MLVDVPFHYIFYIILLKFMMSLGFFNDRLG